MSRDESSADHLPLTTDRFAELKFILEDPVYPDKTDFAEPDYSSVLNAVLDLPHDAAATLLQNEIDRAGSGARGPRTCVMFLELGIRRFELGQSALAERAFESGLAMARDIDNQGLIGAFLHELSITYWQRGIYPKALEQARDSVVVKLSHFYQHAGAARRLRHPAEPFAAIHRLASLLMILKRWREADAFLAYLLDSCSARNDIPVLIELLIAHAHVALASGKSAEADQRLGRAVWASRVSGINVDALLAANFLAYEQTALPGCPVRSTITGRDDLEQSLIKQYREIALGLLADRLMRNQDLSERGWWQQFCSQRRSPPPYLADAEDEAFVAFQNEILQAVLRRKIRPIAPAELLTRKITINNGEIFCWQDGAINRHLAEIGSSLRLFMAGSQVARAGSLLTMLGEAPRENITISDFILGDVAPMTSLGKACLFDFIREYALSPTLNADSAGLHDEGRIVLRQILVRTVAEYERERRPMLEELTHCNTEASDPDAVKAAGAELALTRMMDEACQRQGISRDDMLSNSLLSHELGHVLQRYPIGTAGPFSSWPAIIRDDLCRFAQTPRTLAQIMTAFRRVFAGLGEPVNYGMFLHSFSPGDSPLEHPLEEILGALLRDKLLTRLADGRLHFAGFVGAT